MRCACVDIGTNTTRLLVAEGSANGYRQIDRRLSFTRLGHGVDEGGVLRPDAIERTVRVVGEYCALAGEFGVTSLRIAATSAVRDARNAQEFVDAAGKVSGVKVEVLSGDEEGTLSFLGATQELEPQLCVVCDIGGGSTEFVLGVPGSAPTGRVSVNIGSVRLTERFLRTDPPATEELILMEAFIDETLGEVEATLAQIKAARLVGVAGTVTALAAIHLGLEDYDPSVTHLARLTQGALDSTYFHLAQLTTAQRERYPALPQGRADVIVAGASILSRTMRMWTFADLVVSEKDILDGLVIETLREG